MANLLITMLAILLASLSEAKPVSPTLLETNNHKHVQSTELDVFQPGPFPTQHIYVKESELASGSPPKPLLITSPTAAGKYAVLLFIHGTCMQNSFYSDLFEHIASHGYIVVAPQIYSCPLLFPFPAGGQDEVDWSTEVANWLPSGLNSVLKGSAKADLKKLAISGHSRGGKSAFAIQLGYSKVPLITTFSALVGLDPVAGRSKEDRTDPKILKYVPHSFDLSIPVTVIGTGLGNRSSCLFGVFCAACAPDEVNHADFYNECRQPASHFVVRDYGHMDMLNDNASGLGFAFQSICKHNLLSSRDPMRKTVGGIVVAFLEAYLCGNTRDYTSILQNPIVAPAVLDPVEPKPAECLAQI